MKVQASAAFSVTSWDEKTWDGQPANSVQGEKLTHAKVTYNYTGDLSGQCHFEYLMTYCADGTGAYVGLEHLEGSLMGRAGSLILEHTGVFDATSVRGEAVVVAGSASGQLTGLTGSAKVEIAGQLPQYPITFEFDLE